MMNTTGSLFAVLLLALPQQKPDPAKVDAAVKGGVEYLRAKVQKQPAATAAMKELILLTLHHAGIRKGDALYDELLKSVLAEKIETTYRASLQAMTLEAIDRVAHQKRIFQCAQFLVDNQCKNGQWSYGEPTTYPEPEPEPMGDGPLQQKYTVKKQRDGRDRGDHSNSQFAALGLRACHDAGIVFPKEVIQKAAQAWRDNQCGTPGKGEGATAEPRGWNYGPKGNPPYGSMTAGGVAALCILDHLQDVNWRKDDAVNAGLNWLRDSFSVTENPGRHGQHLHYYLYALERACTLFMIDRLGKVDWYAEGARQLLATQLGDGSWEKSPVDTCHAVLFLCRATRPLRDPKDLDRKMK